MRRLPKENGKLVAPSGAVQISVGSESRNSVLIRQERRYELITPLFGGGVEAKKNDLDQLINGKSVRGQLRFWWRASRGTGSVERMRENEFSIWGAASRPESPSPSKVSVVVSVTKTGEPDTPFLMSGNKPRPDIRNSMVPPYAAFALQPTDEEIREAQRQQVSVHLESVRLDVEFTLRISFPEDLRDEVEAALWCWQTFGGVGARTRRGFGAISLKSLIENGADITPEKWKFRDVTKRINEQLPAIMASGEWDSRVPHVPRNTTGALKVTSSKYSGERSTVTNTKNNVLKSWWYLIDKLHQFRQSPRNEKTFAGRSDWPEADEIRRHHTNLTGRNTLRKPVHKVQKFPRAQFGLPIVFKFKDDDKGEPPKATLQGTGGQRLGSPLILRPILCADGAVSLAMILESPRFPEGGVELEGYGSVNPELSVGQEKEIRPLSGKSAKADVLRAFLESL